MSKLGLFLKTKHLFYVPLFHLLLLLALLVINQHIYPRSLFAWAIEPILQQTFSTPAITILLSLLGLAVLIALLESLRYTVKNAWARNLLLSIAGAGTIYHIGTSALSKTESEQLSKDDQPNVFLIGIDSLNPELIDSKLTPNLFEIAKYSSNFTSAYTPLGRTFPAWASILTGKHPVDHGARFNLSPHLLVKTNETLAWDLKKQGYTTAYLTDEKRFANFDESWGFDLVGGPRIGLTDFLLGPASDFPVLNLLRKTSLGKYLERHNIKST